MPECAEGLLKPAFKWACLSKLLLHHPGVHFFKCLCRQDSISQVPTTPLHIKFYMNSWVVNQCSEDKGEGRCSKRLSFFLFFNLYSSLTDVLTHALVKVWIFSEGVVDWNF